MTLFHHVNNKGFFTIILAVLLLSITFSISNVELLGAGPPYPVTLYIPQERTISVDGFGSDWSGIPPRYLDPKGDLLIETDEGTDLGEFYVAKDNSFLYVMIKFFGNPNPTHKVAFDVDSAETFQIGVYKDVGLLYVYPNKIGIEAAFQEVVEIKIPLTILSSPTFLRAKVSTSDKALVDMFDRWIDVRLSLDDHVISGPQTTVVIPVYFSDVASIGSEAEIHYKVFDRMDSYFREVSYGKANITGTITPWTLLPNTREYYLGNIINNPPKIAKFVSDIVKAVDSQIDFSQYIHIMIVYAGMPTPGCVGTSTGTSYAGPTSYSGVPTDDGVDIYRAVIVAEGPIYQDRGDTLPQDQNVGVYTHEIGHNLTFYPRGVRLAPGIQGHWGPEHGGFVGHWDLMEIGYEPTTDRTPLLDGSPAHLTSWTRSILGWLSSSEVAVVNPGESMTITIDALELPTNGVHAVVYPIGPYAYYLIEVREKIGFDSALPDSGVLILKVDESLPRTSTTGQVMVVDANPLIPYFDDAAFHVGQYYEDIEHGVRFTILSSNGNSYTISVGGLFSDILSDHWAYDYILAIYKAGITRGCAQDDPNTPENERRYCPEENVTRGQMAAFIIRAKYGETFSYSTTPYFTDVPSTHTFFKYVQKLRDDGITVVSGTYGVDTYVTRGQMAAFIIRAKYGENFSYTTTPYFSDVPATHGFFKYVQKLKDDGITAVTGTYGVDDIVTRAQMATFLARAFLGME